MIPPSRLKNACHAASPALLSSAISLHFAFCSLHSAFCLLHSALYSHPLFVPRKIKKSDLNSPFQSAHSGPRYQSSPFPSYPCRCTTRLHRPWLPDPWSSYHLIPYSFFFRYAERISSRQRDTPHLKNRKYSNLSFVFLRVKIFLPCQHAAPIPPPRC
jgi:hypothetical protein